MSFLNKICKFDKLSIYKGFNVFQKSNSASRYASIISNNSCICNNILWSNNVFNKKYYYNWNEKQTKLYNSYYSYQLVHAHRILNNSENLLINIADTLPIKEDAQISNLQDILDKSWVDMSISELLENFECISYYVKYNNESVDDLKYRGIQEVIANRIQEFDDKQIQYLLKCLILWNADTRNEVYKKLWNAIDSECLKRVLEEKWTYDDMLLVNDLFFKLKLNRSSNFSWHSLSKIGRKALYLTPAHLVQLAFFMITSRILRMNVYNVEYAFEQCCDQLTIDELSIFAMAFDKYSTTIKSKDFLIKIMQKLIDNIDTVSDTTIVSILRILRCIKTPDYLEQLDKLIVALESQVPTRDIYAIIEFMAWIKELRMEKKELISKILERCEKEVASIKLKGFEKIYFALFTLNYDPKTTPFFSIGMNELMKPERKEEIDQHIKSFVKINLSLLNRNFYVEEAVRRVLSPEVVAKYSHNNSLLVEHLYIHYAIEIEHPEYTGPRLEESYVERLHKRFGAYNAYTTRKNRKIVVKYDCLNSIKSTCQKITGSESYVHEDTVLPHLAMVDVILCYDPETNKYVSPAEQLGQIPLGEIKYAPKDGKEWYVLVLSSPLVYLVDTKNPTGYLVSRLRMLERIGYKPIVVPLDAWRNLEDDSAREKHMRELLLR